MSFSSQPLVLRPSRYHQCYLVLLHLVSAGLPWLAAVPRWSSVLLTGVICGAMCYQLLRYRKEFPCVLSCTDTGWTIKYSDDEQRALLTGDTWVTPWLTVLGLRTGNGICRRIALWPDSAAVDDIRRVRVLLRNTRHSY